MIIVTVEDQVFGVVVDAIDKVVGIQKSTIQPPHPLFGDISIKYIAGVVESNNHLYILLDIDRIFGSKAPKIEKQPVENRAQYSDNRSAVKKPQQAIKPVKQVVEEPKTIDNIEDFNNLLKELDKFIKENGF